MNRRRLLASIGTVLAGASLAGRAAAQTFPSRPVRLVVPFTPGSGTDIVARAIGPVLSKGLGQPVVIENRPGAGGTIGALQVARSDPDGYTLLVHSAGHALNPAIYPNLPYDTVADFAGVTPLASLPNVLVVPPARGWKTVADVIAAAKARPDQLNYASAGNGSATHMNAEKFRLQAGIAAVHVPFKGTPEAMTEVAAGRIDWFFAPLSSALPMIREGRVAALAVSTPARAPALPEVPTTVEAGVRDSEYLFWVGMLAPVKTPADVLRRLHDETVAAVASPEVRERFLTIGAEPFTMESRAFDEFIRAEVASAARIARAAHLQAS
jgi:tripartite-type tricarboxylate transporter receptor subunit TctC